MRGLELAPSWLSAGKHQDLEPVLRSSLEGQRGRQGLAPLPSDTQVQHILGTCQSHGCLRRDLPGLGSPDQPAVSPLVRDTEPVPERQAVQINKKPPKGNLTVITATAEHPQQKCRAG